jgi:hypothetical protein
MNDRTAVQTAVFGVLDAIEAMFMDDKFWTIDTELNAQIKNDAIAGFAILKECARAQRQKGEPDYKYILSKADILYISAENVSKIR